NTSRMSSRSTDISSSLRSSTASCYRNQAKTRVGRQKLQRPELRTTAADVAERFGTLIAVGTVGGSENRSRYVRFGSEADIRQRQTDVRFTPKSRHWLNASGCPLCATSRHPPGAGNQRNSDTKQLRAVPAYGSAGEAKAVGRADIRRALRISPHQ